MYITRISKEFLKDERCSMPDAWFRAEYMAEFTDAIDSVFSFDQVMGPSRKTLSLSVSGGEV